MKIGFCGLFLILCFAGRAQQMLLQADPEIDKMLQSWIGQNRTNPGIDGWRLQLMSTTDRAQVESGKVQFLNLFPRVPADWVHEKPYYKLRVGAFYTRQEALSFLVELNTYYSGAYPTRDSNIHPRDFLE